MRVVIEAVGVVAGLDLSGQAVHRHVHEAELGVVLHLFLPEEGHGAVGVHARRVHEVAALDEHAARTAGWVQQCAFLRLDDVHDHLHQGFRREEDAVVGGDVLGELVQEVFVDAADHVAAHGVDLIVVEDAQQLGQKAVGEVGVGLGGGRR